MDTTLVIVSGLSGAGRTTVIKALEDLGFYCVDNLPVVLLEPFVDLFREGSNRLAVVIDVREGSFLDSFPAVYDRLRAGGVRSELLFLEASDDVLVTRFGETRRAHPAGAEGSLAQQIALEREILAPVAARADLVTDTSAMSVHDLKRFVTRRFTGADRAGAMQIELLSFGFRYGVPEEANLMLDVRFLPNPNFERDLHEKTGLVPEVAAYVLRNPVGEEFLSRLYHLLDFLAPQYEEEGKAYLTIAVGCTGGQHRSVAVVGALEAHLRARTLHVRASHRDVERVGRPDS